MHHNISNILKATIDGPHSIQAPFYNKISQNQNLIDHTSQTALFMNMSIQNLNCPIVLKVPLHGDENFFKFFPKKLLVSQC